MDPAKFPVDGFEKFSNEVLEKIVTGNSTRDAISFLSCCKRFQSEDVFSGVWKTLVERDFSWLPSLSSSSRQFWQTCYRLAYIGQLQLKNTLSWSPTPSNEDHLILSLPNKELGILVNDSSSGQLQLKNLSKKTQWATTFMTDKVLPTCMAALSQGHVALGFKGHVQIWDFHAQPEPRRVEKLPYSRVYESKEPAIDNWGNRVRNGNEYVYEPKEHTDLFFTPSVIIPLSERRLALIDRKEGTGIIKNLDNVNLNTTIPLRDLFTAFSLPGRVILITNSKEERADYAEPRQWEWTDLNNPKALKGYKVQAYIGSHKDRVVSSTAVFPDGRIALGLKTGHMQMNAYDELKAESWPCYHKEAAITCILPISNKAVATIASNGKAGIHGSWGKSDDAFKELQSAKHMAIVPGHGVVVTCSDGAVKIFSIDAQQVVDEEKRIAKKVAEAVAHKEAYEKDQARSKVEAEEFKKKYGMTLGEWQELIVSGAVEPGMTPVEWQTRKALKKGPAPDSGAKTVHNVVQEPARTAPAKSCCRIFLNLTGMATIATAVVVLAIFANYSRV